MIGRFNKSIQNVKHSGSEIVFSLSMMTCFFSALFFSYLNFGLWLGQS